MVPDISGLELNGYGSPRPSLKLWIAVDVVVGVVRVVYVVIAVNPHFDAFGVAGWCLYP